MSKEKDTELEVAFSTISEYSPIIASELIEGNKSDTGFDKGLILDIANAFSLWHQRNGKIKDPYCVWFFDGILWSKKTKDMYQQDAYKEWYKLTSGGKKNSNPNFESYYFLGLSNVKLNGRHETGVDEESFSIKYLLSKSFKD